MYMYKYPTQPNEIYHYGIKRRSGRYPYGSGDRPYQHQGTKKLTSSEQISKDTFDKIKSIHDSLTEHEKKYLGEMSISKYTRYAKTLGDSYITMDDYGGEYKDEHPHNGLIISIASGKKDRGSGNTDKLIKKAIKDSGTEPLIAEIDVDNVYSKKLFERNGFKYFDEIDDIMFYRFDKDLKHSECEVKFKMNNIQYLSHGGPGSGRYPWGSGKRPYQRLEMSGNNAVMARKGISGYIRSRKQKKAEKQQKEVEAEKQKRKREEERLDADKERVLREGTISEVMKYRGRLTNKELEGAVNRLTLESKLKNMSEREMKSGMDKMNEMMKKVKMGTEWVNIGTETYNTLASIYNATPEGRRKPLRTVRRS